jgi:hypothetical protein
VTWTDDELVQMVNDSGLGLAASVCTRPEVGPELGRSDLDRDVHRSAGGGISAHFAGETG